MRKNVYIIVIFQKLYSKSDKFNGAKSDFV